MGHRTRIEARAALAGLPTDAVETRARWLLTLAGALIADGDADEAVRVLDELCGLADRLDDPNLLAHAQTERAEVAGLQARADEARLAYATARTIWHQAGLTCSARWYTEQAWWLAEEGCHDEALSVLAEGIAVFDQAASVGDVTFVRLQRAALLCRHGRWPDATADLPVAELLPEPDTDKRLILAAAAAHLAWLLAADRPNEALMVQRRLTSVPAALFTDPEQFRLRYDLACLAAAQGAALPARAILEPLSAWLARAGFGAWHRRAALLLTDLERLPAVGRASDVVALPAPADDGAGEAVETYRIRCFGGIDVVDATGTGLFRGHAGINSRTALAILMAKPRGTWRDTLFEALYSDRDVLPKALAVVISRVRSALARALDLPNPEALIHWVDGRYVLDEAVWRHSDLYAFDQAERVFTTATTDGPRLRAAERLVALYHGPAFGALSDRSWAVLTHARTRRQWLSAGLWLHQHRLAQGDLPACLDLLRRLLAIDPMAESLHRANIDVLLRMGNPEAARMHESAMHQLLVDVPGSPGLGDFERRPL